VLGIHASALDWPIGSGRDFAGVVDRRRGDVLLFSKTAAAGALRANMERMAFDDPRLLERVGPELLARARHDLELLEVAGNPFDRDAFLRGEVTPVFFGSALTNFGVEPFFDAFVELAPPPGARVVDLPDGTEDLLDPVTSPFSAYVFKVQANMDKRHRDVLAFVRVCSGVFQPDEMVHHHRLGKDVRLARPHGLVAQSREVLDVAWPGDIVGLINRDTFHIGDTISAEGGFDHKPLPSFPPEHFARISPRETSGRKRFDKGLDQLCAEGTVQRLWPEEGEGGAPIVAAVGRLQFEVLQYRLRDEYGVETVLEPLPYECSAWLDGDRKSFVTAARTAVVKDRRGRTLVLFPTEWDKRQATKRNPDHQLRDVA
jgi:peptide chain release factor 3